MESLLGIEAFTSRHAVKLTGVTLTTLERWEESGFLSPSLLQAEGTGSRRVFSFVDIVAIRVAVKLRELGVNLKAVQRALAHVQARKGLSGMSSLPPTMLVTDGTAVFELNATTAPTLMDRPAKEAYALVSLDVVVEELQQAARKLRGEKSFAKIEHPLVQRAAARARRRAA